MLCCHRFGLCTSPFPCFFEHDYQKYMFRNIIVIRNIFVWKIISLRESRLVFSEMFSLATTVWPPKLNRGQKFVIQMFSLIDFVNRGGVCFLLLLWWVRRAKEKRNWEQIFFSHSATSWEEYLFSLSFLFMCDVQTTTTIKIKVVRGRIHRLNDFYQKMRETCYEIKLKNEVISFKFLALKMKRTSLISFVLNLFLVPHWQVWLDAAEHQDNWN